MNQNETWKNDTLKFPLHSYFLSLRSFYVSFSCGDKLIIKPYNPYQFGCQFRFYQDKPNDIGYTPKVSLDNVLYHWRICVHRGYYSQVYLLVRMLNLQNHVTARFRDWWLSKHGDYLQKKCRQISK